MNFTDEKSLAVPSHRPASVFNGCGQACVKMIVHYFEGDDLSVEELNKICGVKSEGAFSGVFDMAAGMFERGYEVVRISDITPQDYHADPVKYMRAVGFDPTGHDEIVRARKESLSAYMQLVDAGKIKDIAKQPIVEDMKKLIGDGYGLVSWVNAEAIAGNFNKTVGHYIVPVEVDASKVVFHDPGVYQKSYGVGVSVVHDLFQSYMYYPESIGINPDTQTPPMMGVLAFRPK